MNINESLNECVNFSQYTYPGDFTYLICGYVYPLVCVGGAVGTVLNLSVLNSTGMKTRTNCFLSAMAASDLCFFLITWTLNLIVYESLSSSEKFISYYYMWKMTLTALANGFSSASIWFAVLVSLERLIAIRSPLHSHMLSRKHKMFGILTVVFLLTFILQIYHLFWMTPKQIEQCANRVKHIFVMKHIHLEDSYGLYYFVTYSLVTIPVLTVSLPVILLVVFNSLLLYYLHGSRRKLLSIRCCRQTNRSMKRYAYKEWKVTITVFAIVSTMIVFNLPSVVYFWYSTIFIKRKSLAQFFNFVVVFGKTLNFLLFFSLSSSFRRRLKKMFTATPRRHLPKIMRYEENQRLTNNNICTAKM